MAGAVHFGDANDGGVEVGARHVHLGHTVGGHGLAGDDHIHRAGVEGGGEALPLDGHDLQLPAILLGDLFGDGHVVAVGVGARVVGDGYGPVGVVRLGPVVGGVGAFHGHGEHPILHPGEGGGGGVFAIGGGISDGSCAFSAWGGGGIGVAAAGGKGEG